MRITILQYISLLEMTFTDVRLFFFRQRGCQMKFDFGQTAHVRTTAADIIYIYLSLDVRACCADIKYAGHEERGVVAAVVTEETKIYVNKP